MKYKSFLVFVLSLSTGMLFLLQPVQAQHTITGIDVEDPNSAELKTLVSRFRWIRKSNLFP